MKESVGRFVNSLALSENRKFFFVIFVLIAGTWLCANAKISGEAWSYFALGLAGAYITGNVAQKHIESKAANTVTTTVTTPTKEK